MPGTRITTGYGEPLESAGSSPLIRSAWVSAGRAG